MLAVQSGLRPSEADFYMYPAPTVQLGPENKELAPPSWEHFCRCAFIQAAFKFFSSESNTFLQLLYIGPRTPDIAFLIKVPEAYRPKLGSGQETAGKVPNLALSLQIELYSRVDALGAVIAAVGYPMAKPMAKPCFLIRLRPY